MVSEFSDDRIDLTPDISGGVVKKLKRKGSGDAFPQKGDTVYVHYVGTLEDGTKFDSSRDRGELFSFVLGKATVIRAWDIGIATMRRNELCDLICKPEFAYGETGSPPKIPPNSTLNFEIELFSWEGEDISPDKDKSIMKSLQVEGKQPEMPNDGSLMDVLIVGRHDNRVFLEKGFQFPLGECTEVGLPEGVDKALKRFRMGEKSLVVLKPRWGYGAKGKSEFNIPPNADLEFEITCNSFEKQKESWQMNEDEKLEESDKLKARGTQHFQDGKYKLALSKYKRLADLLQFETHLEGNKRQRRDALYHAAHLNMALCFLKKNETAECIKHCQKVLDESKENVKALYRRGQAYQHQNDFNEAINDYENVLRIEADNKAAKLGIQQCKEKLKQQKEKDKKIYAGIFEKMTAKNVKDDVKDSSSGAKSNDVLNDDEDMPQVDAAQA